MPHHDLAEFLSWDSEFFGCRIARVKGNALEPGQGGDVLDWCAAEKIDCLYFLADPASEEAVSWAQDSGFQLVDIRVTLHIDLGAWKPAARAGEQTARIRPSTPADLPFLKPIARASHRDSRFYWDRRLRHKSGDLFETWIVRSCEDFASIVLVAESGGTAAGYITLDYTSSSDSRIGLFAVGPEARGRGVGQQLVCHGLEWLRSQGAEQSRVVTQGRNRGALRLYQKAGFCVEDLKLWYHLWSSRPPAP